MPTMLLRRRRGAADRPEMRALDSRIAGSCPFMSTPPPAPWLDELVWRARRHLLLKAAGTTLWVWVFFIAYFHLLRHAVYPVATVPLTRLDAWVPFVPSAIVPYLSLWLYVGVAPGLQRTFRELLAYGGWAALLCAAGLAIFYRWPTRIPAFVFDAGGFPGFALLEGIDAAGNACPSMHVAIAMFTAIWVDVLLRECRTPVALRVINWFWFASITFATLAIRQHVAIDAMAGAALGAAFAWASLAWRPGRGARRHPAIMRATEKNDRKTTMSSAR